MISKEQVELAFIKLKSYFYYDHSLLHVRNEILLFEKKDFENKIQELTDALNQLDVTYFEKLISNISFVPIPKNINAQKATKESNSNFYVNRVTQDAEIQIQKINLFIKCSVELHLFAVIFLEFIGPLLEEKINRKNYGNRLEIDPETKKIKSGYRLFKPYFDEYKKWRDQCISTSRKSLDSGNNVAILNIDLKSFYYSCNFEVSNLKTLTPLEFDHFLIDVLDKIHKAYNQKIKAKYSSIPIGLLSSGPIANYYLTRFDNVILDKLNPIYYGRYVDDILLAININNIEDIDLKNPTDDFFEKHFIRQNIFRKETNSSTNKDKASYIVDIKYYQNAKLIVQESKVLLHYFDHNGSSSLLNKIIEEIRRNSSEFRFLPDEINSLSFDESSHSLIYKDSSNSIRNIQEYSVNRFEISKFFARLNMLSGLTNQNEMAPHQTFNEIKNFFRCGSAIELSGFWEKAFTSYILNNKTDALIKLLDQIQEAISSIELKLNPEDNYFETDIVSTDDVKKYLISHLKSSIAQASSLNVNIFKVRHLKVYLEDKEWNDIIKLGKLIVSGHYIRHHLTLYPIFNFLNQIITTDFDYTSRKLTDYLQAISKQKISALNSEWSLKKYPRFIHYHEIQLLFLMIELVNITQASHSKKYIRSRLVNVRTNEFFLKINHLEDDDQIKLPTVIVDEAKATTFNKETDTIRAYTHLLPSNFNFPKKETRFGLVNLQINENKAIENILYGGDISYQSFFHFAKILNEANYQNCDYTVFPEVSVPTNWLPLFVNESRKKDMSFHMGLEHFEFNGYVFNLTIGILEFKTGQFANSYILMRVKNIPSHEERRIIEGHSKEVNGLIQSLHVATPNVPTYDLIVHNNTYSTIFNCFELSDIQSRAIFKSKLDFLLAIENNKDTNYFSSVVDSTARDLHSFVIQINNSLWGDSRITKPAKSDEKDTVKIKGGDNIFLVTENIDVMGLRKFQRLTYELQRENKKFKPVPARFKPCIRRKAG